MHFRVKIRKADDVEEERVIEASSRFDLYQIVQKEGATVLNVDESDPSIWSRMNIQFGTGIKRREIIMFAKNLSAMLTAGLQLARALSVLERQSRNKHFKSVVIAIGASVTKGAPFNDALRAYPNVFPRLFIAMVLAGEESGGLASALSVIGLQMERSEELARKIKGAMIYPAIILIAVVIISILMMIFVVPTLTSTFTQLKVQLPLATRIITDVSTFMVGNILLVLAILVLSVALLVLFFRSQIGKAAVLRVALILPVIGGLVRETFAARAARTLSSLLTAGVQMVDAIEIAGDVVGAPLFAEVLTKASALVKKGQPLSSAFLLHPDLYPLMMSDMISVGEETGKLSDMLRQVAEFYEVDVAEKTKDLSTIIEPVLMLFIGTVVGIFAVSMIAPIYSLGNAF